MLYLPPDPFLILLKLGTKGSSPTVASVDVDGKKCLCIFDSPRLAALWIKQSPSLDYNISTIRPVKPDQMENFIRIVNEIGITHGVWLYDYRNGKWKSRTTRLGPQIVTTGSEWRDIEGNRKIHIPTIETFTVLEGQSLSSFQPQKMILEIACQYLEQRFRDSKFQIEGHFLNCVSNNDPSEIRNVAKTFIEGFRWGLGDRH